MSPIVRLFSLTQISPSGIPQASANSVQLGTILQIVFSIVGALGLLMITVSGLRYITAAGDPQKTASAKNGIVYSLVGIAIAVSAMAIVSFVVRNT